MEITRLSDLRPRAVWDLVDDAFDLYRERFALFAGITAVALVPHALLTALVKVSLFGPTGSPEGAGGGAIAAYFGFTISAYSLATIFQSGAIAVAVEDRLRGRRSTIFSAYRRALRRFWPLLTAALLYIAMALLGVLTLFAGTVLAMLCFAFLAQAVVLEGRGGIAALRRSRALMRPYPARIFGMLGLVFLLSLLLTAGVALLLEGIFALFPGLHARDAAAEQLRAFALETAAYAVGDLLVAPLAPLATTLLYYDLRVRREGLDMEAQAESLGLTLAPDPFATPS